MMTAVRIVTLATLLGVVPVWLIVFMVRRHLNCMAGMMVAMAQAMGTGLLAGALLGASRPGDLWWATLAGSAAGIGVGVLTGAPIGLMAILDGSLSGLMSGMMGAMLGVMLPDQTARVAETGGVLLLVISLLSVLLVVREVGGGPLLAALRNLLARPLGLALIAGLAAAAVFSLQLRRPHTPQEIVVRASEYRFSTPVLQVEQGKAVRLRLINAGSLEHGLLVKGIGAPESMAHHDHGGHGAPPIQTKARPGGESILEFVPAQPGIYKAVCTTPGHERLGMSLTLVVRQGERPPGSAAGGPSARR